MNNDHYTQCPHCGQLIGLAKREASRLVCSECFGQGYVVKVQGDGSTWSGLVQGPCPNGCPPAQLINQGVLA